MEFVGRSDYQERNDCVIRAFSVVADKPYVAVHSDFKTAGRKTRCRTKFRVIDKVASQYGFEKVRCRMTVKRFLDDVAHIQAVAAHISGHMFAVVNGEVADLWPVNPRCIVTWYLQPKK
jgi:hypothetical protein